MELGMLEPRLSVEAWEALLLLAQLLQQAFHVPVSWQTVVQKQRDGSFGDCLADVGFAFGNILELTARPGWHQRAWGGWVCHRLRGHMVTRKNKDLEEIWAF